MKRRTTYAIVGAGIILFVMIPAYQILWAPNVFSGEQIVIVSKGMNFRQIGDSLEAHRVIRSRVLFEIAGKLLGKTRDIHIGKYLFRSGLSNSQILDYLSTGKATMLVAVTIPEGLRAATQARVFKRDLGIDSARYAQLVRDSAFVRSLGIEANTLEGYLLPDTYLFYWQTDEERVISRLVEAFKEFYVDSLKRQAAEVAMTTNEVLTLASIVEGEAILDSERPIIAGVYFNRMRKRMRLQADPTLQYILEDGPRRLYYRDLQIQSPYNTYRHYGLPPGPINNPGKASILAVLYPAKHRYLYFVSNGQGGHVFSRTYGEHQRAVNRYRRSLRHRSLGR